MDPYGNGHESCDRKSQRTSGQLVYPRSRSTTPVDTNAWGEFVVGELFDNVTRGTRLKKSDRKVGSTPLVTAGSENQGIAEHVLENKELFSGINLTIDMFGNVFARNYPFYADDNILVLKTNNRTFNQLQFMASSLAHLANEYGYTNQFRQNTLNNTTINFLSNPSQTRPTIPKRISIGTIWDASCKLSKKKLTNVWIRSRNERMKTTEVVFFFFPQSYDIIKVRKVMKGN